MEDLRCKACGTPLTRDDIGAHKKLINRGASSFLCIPCLARHFSVEESLIRQKVEEFRKSGCTLFA